MGDRLGLWIGLWASFTLPAALGRAAEIPVDPLDSPKKGWSAVGRAQVSADKDGYKGGCLKAEFGAPGTKPYGLIQGDPPSAAEAWARRGDFTPDGFVFWARAEEPVALTMTLRVRKRDVQGPAGVVGQAKAPVTIEKGPWRRYEVPFAAFSCDAALGKAIGPALFEPYWPQVQFSMEIRKGLKKPKTVWIDEIALDKMSAEALAAKPKSEKPTGSGEAKMEWPGLELAAELQESRDRFERFDPGAPRPATAPGMTAAAPAGAREIVDLGRGWTFLAIDPGTGRLREPKPISLPNRWEGGRDFSAGWNVLRVNLSRNQDERLVVCFEQVPLFCALFVNGKECGRHLGSFTPFEFDVTEAAVEGDNLLALYVHDESAALEGNRAYNQLGVLKPSKLRFRGGIWGGVELERRRAAYVADVFVQTSTRRGEMELVCELANAAAEARPGRLEFALVEWPDGKSVDLSIPPREVELAPLGKQTVSVSVPWKNPRLWSPEQPNLYVLQTALKCAGGAETVSTRFGFREFWVEGKQFFLNGTPIRLRGESNFRVRDLPQGRDRNFNREVFLIYKSLFGVNACRIHASIGPVAVFQGADEAGMLLINQSSIWSAMGSAYRNGGERFLENTKREFAEWVRRDRNSPSVAIWDVENEMIRSSRASAPWASRFDGFVLEHDETRPIEHSGAGWYNDDQQIVHLHMQEHYTSVLQEWVQRGRRPVILGEFWVGGRGETRLPSSQEFRSSLEYAEEEARLYEMYMLEMRYFGASGVMPFTIHNPAFTKPEDGRELWAYEPGSPPAYATRSPLVVERIRHGLQPLTVFFWPRTVSAAAGEELKKELVVCNDSEEPRSLTAQWTVGGGDSQLPHRLWVTTDIELAPGEQRRIPVACVVPGTNCRLLARLLEQGQAVSSDALAVRAIAPERLSAPGLKRRLVVYEGEAPGAVEALRRLGLKAEAGGGVPEGAARDSIWIIAPRASNAALSRQSQAIRECLESGGRILCLAQEQWPRWSPIRLSFWSAVRAVPGEYADFGVAEGNKDIYYSLYAPIYAAGHPAFAGISGQDLRWWSSFDGRVSDDALVRPAAVGARGPGAWRVLAGACRTENASIVEARVGDGLLVFCQAQVLEQSENPEARAVLFNLLRYLDGAGWTANPKAVRLTGSLTAEQIAVQTSAAAEALSGGAPEDGGVLIAGDGASPEELAAWAEAGGTVLVLSGQTAGRLPGYAVEKADNHDYAAARGEDHPLLWGVSSTSFTDFEHSCVDGELSAYPKDARVLLHGLKGKSWATRMTGNDIGRRGLTVLDAAGPVAVAQRKGQGEWVVTTLAPWRAQGPHDAELLSALLANAGAPIPAPLRQALGTRAFQTVPLKIDGRLDDWTNDVEDRNVSPFRHAEPVALSFEDAAAGSLRSDAEFSAVIYFLWNEKALFTAGAVFGAQEGSRVAIRIGERTLSVAPVGKGASARIEEAPEAALRAAGGALANPGELIDSRALSFTVIDSRVGHLRTQDKVRGATFEVEVPWAALGRTAPPVETRVLIRAERGDGVILQAPFDARSDAPETWLALSSAP